MAQDNNQSKTYEIHNEYHGYILVVSQLLDIQYVDWRGILLSLIWPVVQTLRLDALDLDIDTVFQEFVMGVHLCFSYS